MARPRAFDELEALETAMHCFWEQGLAGASMRDLTDRMGIAGPSLYNAFGNKLMLFEKALAHYCQTRTHRFLCDIEGRFDPDQRIAELFAEVVHRAATDRERRGCFLINSALEVAPHDAHLRRVVGGHMNRVRGFFQRSLEQAASQEARPRDIAAHADHLLVLLLGLRVLARAKPDRRAMENAVASALAPLGLGPAWEGRRRTVPY